MPFHLTLDLYLPLKCLNLAGKNIIYYYLYYYLFSMAFNCIYLEAVFYFILLSFAFFFDVLCCFIYLHFY